MSESRFAPHDDELEFLPATQEQVDRLGQLVRDTLDGDVTLAKQRRTFVTNYFEGEFARAWVVRYNGTTGWTQALDDKEADRLLAAKSAELMGVHGMLNNSVGLSLGLSNIKRYDGGFLDVTAPLRGTQMTYGLMRDPAPDEAVAQNLTPGIDLPPSEVSEKQAHILLDLIDTLDSVERGETDQPDIETAMVLQEQFDAFNDAGYGHRLTRRTQIAAKSRLLQILEDEPTIAIFQRRFQKAGELCIVSLGLTVDALGRRPDEYSVEIRTAAGEEDEGSADIFVNNVEWRTDMTPFQMRYFDTDLDKAVELRQDDPDFDFTRDFSHLLTEAIQKRGETRRQYAAERAQGFHEFSQADANRIMVALENPGEEINPLL